MSSPAAATVHDAAAVADGLAAARVLDPARLRDLLAEYKGAHDSADGDGFIEFLVQQGLLTPYQAQAVAADEAAQLNVGPFLLLDSLGGNSLGTACRAVRRDTRARYAVRVMPMRSLWKAREAKRHVARLAALPPHPTLVPLSDADTDGGRHYLAWPFTDGESLRRAVAREPLSAGAAARLFADLADGLAVCHAAGVSHGLIKPSSILIGYDRRPRLLDLGLGDVLGDGEDDDSVFDTIATSHAAVERMDYTPPEVVTDPTVRTPEADVYSLGAVFYLAVTGDTPFPDGSVVDKMIAHQTRDPLPVRMRNPHVPTAVAGLIERMLAKSPADRPTAAGVRDLLRTVAEETPDPQPLSVTASTLRDAVALSQTFKARKRAGDERDTEGTIDFDLPVSPAPTPDPEPPPTPTPAPKPARPPDPPPVESPRRIQLPALPVVSEPARPVKAVPPPPAATPVRASGVLPRPADLPRPVGWETDRGTAAGDVVTRPPVVVPPPPRHNPLGSAARSLAFWRPPADDVQLSVFGPPEIAPGQRVKFIIYAHLPGVSDNVITLCRAMNKGTELLGAGHAERPVSRGATLALHLTLTSAGVAKSHVKFPWAGQPQPKTFDVFVPWESPPGLAGGTLTVALDDATVATVPIHFVVLPRGR